ncbi:hypothetical protein M2163_000556 [Streptomyces sp. SAI-135]|nr:hypothetical protein [Streptomyces sp. SAI-133]MDH6613448.1 hypothetical protein [Streptomyces sp. SAI-135]
MRYDCAVCLNPLSPDSAGMIKIAGVIKDGPDHWVWGPYPVHDVPCREQLAHPAAGDLLTSPEHTETSVRCDPSDPAVNALLKHWKDPSAPMSASRTLGGTHLRYWPADRSSGPEAVRAHTPWPGLDAVMPLAPSQLLCLGVRPQSPQRQMGYDIAVHNAAQGLRVVMFAPDLPPRNPVPGLTVYRDSRLTPESIRERLHGGMGDGARHHLVVIDRLEFLSTSEDAGTLSSHEQVGEVCTKLKEMAASDSLGCPSFLLMAHTDHVHRRGAPVHLSEMRIAIKLENYVDSLVLLSRTHPDVTSFTKDRSGSV